VNKLNRYLLVVTILGLFLPGCVNIHANRHVLFQTSTIYALLDGAYDGNITYGELKKHGDTGIGTFDGLDGEMIEVNGIFSQIKADGVAYPVDDSMTAPFAMVTFFEPDRTLLIKKSLDYHALEKYLDDALPTKNIFYAIRIDGSFTYVRTRSVPKQNKPYLPLVEVVKNQPVFEFHDVQGTIVGFRLPDYMKEINMPGYHFHFITENRKAGGHLLECRIEEGKAEIDETAEFYMILPKDAQFYKRDLTKDRQKELEGAER
jgi:acetolactate decarboxylase